MLKRAEAESHTAARSVAGFRTMVERPMGTITASGLIIGDPSLAGEFSALLEAANSRVRSRAAWSLGYAAAKGADIGAAWGALKRSLRDEEPDVAMAGAYALANACMARGDEEGLETLKSHNRPQVRMGAHIAILDR
ncbi:MAG TPA: hypothetical protein VLD37_03115 [Candidatus Bilamarchaeum sp.]|nr:hypothetical protein [Candidatus Bilamarchaeum sp.]